MAYSLSSNIDDIVVKGAVRLKGSQLQSIRLSVRKPNATVLQIEQLIYNNLVFSSGQGTYVSVNRHIAEVIFIVSVDDDIYLKVRYLQEINRSVLGYRQFLKTNDQSLLIIPFRDVSGRIVMVHDPPNFVAVFRAGNIFI
jgi:hypothetical protein